MRGAAHYRYQAVPAGLTAEVLARAVVAAARSYGDDPVRAMTSASPMFRRSLTAAAVGTAEAYGITVRRTAPMLDLSGASVGQKQRDGSPAFRAAADAAAEAVRAVMTAPEPEAPKGAVAAFVEAKPPAGGRSVAAAPPRPEPLTHAPTRPPSRPLSGRISQGLTTEGFYQPAKGRADDRPLTARIVSALTDKGRLSAMTLAYLCDAKELLVGQALRQLQSEGRATPGPLPASGAREQLWRLMAEDET